jgi:hypothetical protein
MVLDGLSLPNDGQPFHDPPREGRDGSAIRVAKRLEQLSVKWLVLKFAELAPRLLARDPFITFRDLIVPCCHSCGFAEWHHENTCSYCGSGFEDAFVIYQHCPSTASGGRERSWPMVVFVALGLSPQCRICDRR